MIYKKMILFASGRTDIIAFYSDWLMNRIREGFVDVRNPYEKTQVTRYQINAACADTLVFCTKNPAPILPYIEELLHTRIPLYFFVTITPYGKGIEPNVPDKNTVITDFIKLSEAVGSQNVCWRYDPVFIDKTYTADYHKDAFDRMGKALYNATDRCVISFIDLYKKTMKNFPGIREVTQDEQKELALSFAESAARNKISVETCAEKLDLSAYGVRCGGCVSRGIIERTCGRKIMSKIPGNSQHLRNLCDCLPTRDIGTYNSCPHLCRYCYANYDAESVRRNHTRHNPRSSFLIGGAQETDKIHVAEQQLWCELTPELF